MIMIEKTSIADHELDILNAFCGYGSLPDANIIFLGSEEGLDYKNITDVINIRMKRAEKNVPLDGKDISNGHYMIAEDEDGSGKIIQMIQYQARLLLHLNDPAVNWFQSSGQNPKAWHIIKDYHFNQIYHEGPQWKYRSALTELRPLPRRNESEWPFLNIDNKAYKKAFQFESDRCNDRKVDDLRNRRVEILRRVFENAPGLKLIIGIGDKRSKKNFLENNFETVLSPLQINGRQFYNGSLKTVDKKVTVVLADFFGNGQLGLKDLMGLSEFLATKGF